MDKDTALDQLDALPPGILRFCDYVDAFIGAIALKKPPAEVDSCLRGLLHGFRQLGLQDTNESGYVVCPIKLKVKQLGLLDHLEHNVLEHVNEVISGTVKASFARCVLCELLLLEIYSWKNESCEGELQFEFDRYLGRFPQAVMLDLMLTISSNEYISGSQFTELTSLFTKQGLSQWKGGVETSIRVLAIPWFKRYCTTNEAKHTMDDLDVHFGRALSSATFAAHRRDLQRGKSVTFKSFLFWKQRDRASGSLSDDEDMDPNKNKEDFVQEPDGSQKEDSIFTILHLLPRNKHHDYLYSNLQVTSCFAFAMMYDWVVVQRGGDCSNLVSINVSTAYCSKVLDQVALVGSPWIQRYHKMQKKLQQQQELLLMKSHLRGLSKQPQQQQQQQQTEPPQPLRRRKLGFADDPESISPQVFEESDSGLSALLSYNYTIGKRVQKKKMELFALIQDTSVEAITYEVVRILNELCNVDESLLYEMFSKVQAFGLDDFGRYKQKTGYARYAACNHIGILCFFLKHGKTLSFDVKPICYHLMTTSLRENLRDPMFAFHLFDMCLEYKMELVRVGFFARFFPALVKCAVWHVHVHGADLLELLPVIVDRDTLLEVFFVIMDLPLLASALEENGPLPPNVEEHLQGDAKWLLFSAILRDQSFSEQPVTNAVEKAKKEARKQSHCYYLSKARVIHLATTLGDGATKTSRFAKACGLAIDLLNMYTRILLESMSQEQILEVVLAMFRKRAYLFGTNEYKTLGGAAIFENTALIFQTCPWILDGVKPFILEVFVNASTVSVFDRMSEVPTHLCYLIGKSIELEGISENLRELFQALVLMVHELVNSMTSSSTAHSAKIQEQGIYYTKFLLTILQTITKFGLLDASCSQDAQFCIARLITFFSSEEQGEQREYISEQVRQQAHKSIRKLEKQYAFRMSSHRLLF